jgi:hypothetical protein
MLTLEADSGSVERRLAAVIFAVWDARMCWPGGGMPGAGAARPGRRGAGVASAAMLRDNLRTGTTARKALRAAAADGQPTDLPVHEQAEARVLGGLITRRGRDRNHRRGHREGGLVHGWVMSARTGRHRAARPRDTAARLSRRVGGVPQSLGYSLLVAGTVRLVSR